MHRRSVEIWVGFIAAIAMAVLFIVAMKSGNIAKFSRSGGYSVEARFDNVGGLKVRSAVKMAGVNIGHVASIDFDGDSFEAVVTVNILSNYDRIPADTSASIFTDGLLGEQYIALEPGGEDAALTDNSTINLTQSALILEQLIGQFLYNKASQ